MFKETSGGNRKRLAPSYERIGQPYGQSFDLMQNACRGFAWAKEPTDLLQISAHEKAGGNSNLGFRTKCCVVSPHQVFLVKVPALKGLAHDWRTPIIAPASQYSQIFCFHETLFNMYLTPGELQHREDSGACSRMHDQFRSLVGLMQIIHAGAPACHAAMAIAALVSRSLMVPHTKRSSWRSCLGLEMNRGFYVAQACHVMLWHIPLWHIPDLGSQGGVRVLLPWLLSCTEGPAGPGAISPLQWL